ncbi:hypothetical protein [Kineosporia sp. A_224]|uniref:hypothetical protein n=1 Tax=Kineosporia sp. A_224 TaxID=1962180 RepID=UPI000B4A8ACD|nr:hypothetical protein [Kineosporia sp. A_224]
MSAAGNGDATSPQGFAGVDPDRVKDVVSAVWDHKDDVASAVEFVRDHGDDLVRLAARLPELLGSVSQFLTGAADDARGAAAFLTGDGGAESSGVKALAALAGEALDACRRELASARDLLDKVGDELADVPIPSVRPTYSEVLGHKLVTGLDLGEGKLLGAASARVREGAERFDGVGAELAKVADVLRKIGGLVDHAGQGLADTATKLEHGGQALGKLTS